MSAKNPIVIVPLTLEEEDQIILTRITNDERPLKRVLKKFNTYTSLAPVLPESGPEVDDAREAFLIELSTFQLSLQKSVMVCEAELRQVEEYHEEKQKLDDEYGTLRGQIEQLKNSLDHAQMIRRRKIEYDVVAEKVNTLPTREELEKTIQDLENDISTIRLAHEDQSQTIQSQKHSLDEVISQLQGLRVPGKESATSALPSRTGTPAPEGATDEDQTSLKEEEGEEGEEKEETRPEDTGLIVNGDDIEMGEVEEEPKSRRKVREDMEEGEATDGSSELSEPPDDD